MAGHTAAAAAAAAAWLRIAFRIAASVIRIAASAFTLATVSVFTVSASL